MDNSTIAAFTTGDVSAFRKIYDTYWRLIYKISFDYLHDTLEAEEAVQDIFSRLWQYRQKIDPGQGVKGYLVKISYSVLVRMVKKKSNELYVQLEEGTLVTDSTNQLMDYKEMYALAQETIDLLPEKRRRIFRMSRDQHMTHEEIANTLGISKKTVENQIREALKFLHTKLQPAKWQAVLLFFLYNF